MAPRLTRNLMVSNALCELMDRALPAPPQPEPRDRPFAPRCATILSARPAVSIRDLGVQATPARYGGDGEGGELEAGQDRRKRRLTSLEDNC